MMAAEATIAIDVTTVGVTEEDDIVLFVVFKKVKSSHAGTRTRVGEVKTRYPNLLDYMGLALTPLLLQLSSQK